MATLINYDELPQLVRDFVGYKLTIQGRARRTADEYALDLRTFFRYLMVKRRTADREEADRILLDPEALSAVDISGIGVEFIASVTPDEIYDFMYYTLRERANQWSARARKLSALKSFYKYLTVNVRLVENDPTKNIDGPQRKNTLPKFLTLEESISLLDAVRSDEQTKTKERDFCILTLFLNCGMRLSELCGINLSDIDKNLESLRVIGKGSKERLIYLNDACRDAITAYLKVRAADSTQVKDKNALFLSSRLSRISNKTVQWMVYKYLKLAGLGNRSLSTHKLRHTAATLMYRSGQVDVRVLKDILGHEQLNTTQIYTHVSSEDMRRAMQTNPLAKKSEPEEKQQEK